MGKAERWSRLRLFWLAAPMLVSACPSSHNDVVPAAVAGEAGQGHSGTAAGESGGGHAGAAPGDNSGGSSGGDTGGAGGQGGDALGGAGEWPPSCPDDVEAEVTACRSRDRRCVGASRNCGGREVFQCLEGTWHSDFCLDECPWNLCGDGDLQALGRICGVEGLVCGENPPGSNECATMRCCGGRWSYAEGADSTCPDGAGGAAGAAGGG